MRITFWGVRGSIPTPLGTPQYQEKLARALVAARDQGLDLDDDEAIRRFAATLAPHLRRVVGGNTSCVELTTAIHADGDGNVAQPTRLIADAGSGIRELGAALMRSGEGFAEGRGVAHILLSHTHWDHILGLPFFVPLYVPGNQIHLYGCHERLEERLRAQHDPRHFPVSFDALPADLHVHELDVGRDATINGFIVRPALLQHPGDSYAYRVSADGHTAVYCTDGEFKDVTAFHGKRAHHVFADADALVFDAMYTFEESLGKVDWGHATGPKGVDLCVAESIKRLILFHHEPQNDDARLFDLVTTTVHYLRTTYPRATLVVDLAREGLTVDLADKSDIEAASLAAIVEEHSDADATEIGEPPPATMLDSDDGLFILDPRPQQVESRRLPTGSEARTVALPPPPDE